MDDGPVALLVRTTSLGPPRFPTLFHFELLLVPETVCKERDTVVVDSGFNKTLKSSTIIKHSVP